MSRSDDAVPVFPTAFGPGRRAPCWFPPTAELGTLRKVFADLSPVPAIRRPDLLPPSVLAAVAEFVPMAQVFGVDPAHADTETLCQVHDLPLNCLLYTSRCV